MRANITGLQAGRLGRGVVHRRRQEVGVVHLHGREVAKAGDVLVMAAEDYSGNTNLFGQGPRPGPEYLSYYTTGAGRTRASPMTSTTSTRAAARRPSPIGVLSHYKAVIWYTANDLYVREPDAARRHGQLEADGRRGDRGPRLPQRPRLGAGHRPAGARRAPGCSCSTTRSRASPTTPWCKSNQTRWARATPMTRSARRRTASSSPTTSSSTTWVRGSASSRPTDDAVSTLPFKGAGGPFGTTAFTLNGGDSARQPGPCADVRDDRRASCRASSRSSTRRARSASTGRRPTTRRRAPSTPTPSPATRASSGCAARST